MKKLFLFTVLIPLIGYAQQSELAFFNHLVGKTWAAEGSWGDGTKFKQETSFSYSLDSTIVIANSKGFTNVAQTTYGMRNHGIRQFDKTSKTLRFWEFDVFGGRTEGTVMASGKNIMYQYAYGEATITDMWEYVDENTYNFIVGSYQDGKWQQTYLKTQFKRID